MKFRVSLLLSALGYAAAQNVTEAPVAMMENATEAPVAMMENTEAPVMAPVAPPPPPVFEYLPGPEVKWFANISPMEGGNKIMLVKEQNIVIATTRDGGLWGLNPASGMTEWNFVASDAGVDTGFSDGGPSVAEKDGQMFMVYGVSSGVKFGSDTTCTIVGRYFDGSVMFISAPTNGQCSGTPKVSGDGQHVFFTHSLHPEGLRNGCFTVISTTDAAVFYTFCADLNQPMSEPGCYNNPMLGNYEGGETNTNDICVMGLAPYNGEEGVGTSATYAFQKPSNPVLQPTHTMLLGEEVGRKVEWQLNAPPLIFDGGYGMLISASRNRILGWFGVPNSEDSQKFRENKFDRLPTARPDSERGDPLWLSSYSHPVITPSGQVFVSGAKTEIRAWLDPEMNSGGGASWTYGYTAQAAAFTQPVLSPDNTRLYFQEGQEGAFYGMDLEGTILWGPERPTGGTAVLGDFSVDESGAGIYLCDQTGQVIAWKIANAPTEAPTSTPTASPTASTMMPSVSPSSAAPVEATPMPSVSPSTMPPETSAPTTASSAFAGPGLLASSVMFVAAVVFM
eukprot:CAMPEP_0194030164 /NCGR_PEP_ID=MMETSP0009_2-20130614/3740_1 /TAXON_ID=210454 /ORGANISM="Grammatophora oceanica, Strain CCMP 410" /LENGTH=563 /DNA_ID=CAMNT_0038670063 /DNA_START=112 /DNA_END=1803 /DNA_ORIENTATION=+